MLLTVGTSAKSLLVIFVKATAVVRRRFHLRSDVFITKIGETVADLSRSYFFQDGGRYLRFVGRVFGPPAVNRLYLAVSIFVQNLVAIDAVGA